MRDLLGLDLEPDAGEHREGVVPAGGDRHLADGGREQVAAQRAGRTGHLGQGRVVLDRQGEQREAGGAAGHDHLGAVGGHLDRPGRQAAGDVGEQPAADQGHAGLGDVGGDLDPGRHLVVEAGQHQAAGRVGVGGQHQARQHGDRRSGRQAAGRPGDCLGQHVALYPEPHRSPPPIRPSPAPSTLTMVCRSNSLGICRCRTRGGGQCGRSRILAGQTVRRPGDSLGTRLCGAPRALCATEGGRGCPHGVPAAPGGVHRVVPSV